MKFITFISRLIVGVLFIISGLIKANDTVGFSYKLEEYFSADVLNLEFLIPLALVMAAGLCIVEVILGVMVLIGSRPKLANWSLMAMTVFFTFLTFYSAYFDKVKDCGCFGDALKLTPWESFSKDVVLLVFVIILFVGKSYISQLFKPLLTSLIALLSFIASLAFGYHVLTHLPSIDFRAYKIGDNLLTNMSTPENAPKVVQEFTWTFDVDGKQKIVKTDAESIWGLIQDLYQKIGIGTIIFIAQVSTLTPRRKGFSVFCHRYGRTVGKGRKVIHPSLFSRL